MRTLIAAVVLCVLTGIVSKASASLLFYDSFNYDTTAGSSLGTAGAANWVRQGTATSDPSVQNGGGLTYPNLQVSSDTKNVQYDGRTGPSGTDAHDLQAANGGAPISSGTVYYSLLMKVP